MTTPVNTARPSIFARLRSAAADIKLAHSVFALPFAILAAFLAFDRGTPVSTPPTGLSSRSMIDLLGLLALVVVCMFFARTWAMLVNRLADRQFDAANPRTARRPLAAGSLSMRDGLIFALAAGVAFQISAGGFWLFYDNPWPTVLAVPVLAWIASYSFTKRFTVLCHVFLGGALAASPIAAAIAVNPHALPATPALWCIAGMVLLWVAGFDIIYALQDMDFDRSANLRSLPARLGASRAVWISRVFHAGAFSMLVLALRADERLGWIFAISLVPVGVLLVAEHVVLARRGLRGLDLAFFTLNGIVSCILGVAGSIDVFV